VGEGGGDGVGGGVALREVHIEERAAGDRSKEGRGRAA